MSRRFYVTVADGEELHWACPARVSQPERDLRQEVDLRRTDGLPISVIG